MREGAEGVQGGEKSMGQATKTSGQKFSLACVECRVKGLEAESRK